MKYAMTETMSGKCKGGPWDGKMFVHYSERKEFFEPASLGLPMNLENSQIVGVKIGEYYWGAHGLWIWLPEGTRSRRTKRTAGIRGTE